MPVSGYTPSGGAQSSRRTGSRRVSHPACERISPSVERVDGAISWSGDALPEELPGLAQDVGALRKRRKYQSVFV